MHAAIAIAKKDLLLLLRDKAGFFFAFIFPVIYASFFGTIFSGGGGGGGSGKMSVVVADADRSAESVAFMEAMKNARELDVSSAAAEEADELVRTGKRSAFVKIPAGFGESRRRMFWGEPPTMVVGVDPSRQAEGGMLQGLLMREFMQGWQKSFSDPEFMKRNIADTLQSLDEQGGMDDLSKGILRTFLSSLDRFMGSGLMRPTSAGAITDPASVPSGGLSGFEPVRIEVENVVGRKKRSGPTNFYSVSFPQGIVWALMGCAAGFGISLVTERTRGTLMRLRVSAISQSQILAGKAIACFVTTVAVSCFMVAVAVLLFGVRPGSYPLLALSIVCVAVCFVGIMMLLSVVGRTEQSAAGIGWAVLMIFAMIGGGMVPTFVMPAWMQKVGAISPIYWSIQALEGPIWRDTPIGGMLLPLLILVTIGAVCFAAGAGIFRSIEKS